MFAPVFLLPLSAYQFVAVADGVPKLDVTPSCRGAAAAKVLARNVDAMQNCLDIEGKAHDQIMKEWLGFTPADRAKCANAVMSFSPNLYRIADVP